MTPDIVKHMVGPFVRRRLVGNKEFVDQYETLVAKEFLSDEEKFKKVMATLRHAYNNVAEYRGGRWDGLGIDINSFTSLEDLKQLPILTKDDVKRMSFPIEGYDDYVTYTGSTTGKPLKLYMSGNSIYHERAFIYHYWSKFGYDYKTSKLITFRAFKIKKSFKNYNPPLYREYQLSPFLLSYKTFYDYVRVIEKFKPDYICGYPYTIMNFCRLAKKFGYHHEVKGLFFLCLKA